MSAVTGELVRAQSVDLRAADIGEQRATQIAGDVAKMIDATNAARELHEFNDEPSRFIAVLNAPAKRTRRT